jgi:hypothetical protein
VRADWDAQTRADKDAADAAREVNRLQSSAAATLYERQRAAAARRTANPSPESEYALHRSICPPPGALGKPLEFGDVPVPDSWLERLRGASAPLGDVLKIVEAREVAAADCRARHAALVRAWPR